MNVKIKQFDVQMAIKNKGIELDVSDVENRHIGDLVITKTRLVWCRGKKDVKNGIPISWKKFIEFMEE